MQKNNQKGANAGKLGNRGKNKDPTGKKFTHPNTSNPQEPSQKKGPEAQNFTHTLKQTTSEAKAKTRTKGRKF